jgi:long-chain acyl-CoA synthetase
MTTQPPFLGIISSERRRDHAEVSDRAGRVAGGLQRLGIGQGNSGKIFKRRLRDPYWARAGRRI